MAAGLLPTPLATILDPQSLNRYAYVLNNPTNYTDPVGLVCSGNNGLGDTPCNPANFGGGGGSGSFDGYGVFGLTMIRIGTEMEIINSVSLWMPTLTDEGDLAGQMMMDITFHSWADVQVGSGIDLIGSFGGAIRSIGGNSSRGGLQINGANGLKQLAPLMEAQEKAELFVTNRILLPATMIGGGLTIAYYSGAATFALCATGVGCLASPITVAGVVGGLALAGEGVYYFFNQNFIDPTQKR